jgi:hypothetical protein
MCRGTPRIANSSASVSITSSLVMLRSTLRHKHSRVNSSTIESHFSVLPLVVRSNTKSQHQTVMALGATEEVKKVSAPQILDRLKGIADNRLRAELSSLRELQLLGGAKGTQGYWLTQSGLEVANRSV